MDCFFGKIDALLEAQSHLQNIGAPYNPESENWHKGKTKIFLINEQRYRRLHSLINPQIVNLQMSFLPLTLPLSPANGGEGGGEGVGDK
jgi:hypothetical protein